MSGNNPKDIHKFAFGIMQRSVNGYSAFIYLVNVLFLIIKFVSLVFASAHYNYIEPFPKKT